MSLIDYCQSERQRQVIGLYESGLSSAQIAVELGLSSDSGVRRTIRRVKKYAASNKGYSPEHDMIHPVPDGLMLSGDSRLYNADGKKLLHWVKSKQDRERQIELMREFAAGLMEETRGMAKRVELDPNAKFQDWLSGYVVGDAHFGMYSWHKETGADFDIKIAQQDLQASFQYLIDEAPYSKIGLLVNVGDFLHANDRKGVTPGHGHILDIDGRYPNVCWVAAQTLKFAVNEMLRKHETVRVINAPGNHDPDGAPWLSICLSMYYENEPRVIVDQSVTQAYYVRFGKNLIMVTHGDKGKPADYIPTMATDRPQDWGETLHRYCWLGHYHHTEQKEHRGGYTEIFPTLAAPDAHARNNFYRSNREMHRIDLHSEFGALSRQKATKPLLDSMRGL